MLHLYFKGFQKGIQSDTYSLFFLPTIIVFDQQGKILLNMKWRSTLIVDEIGEAEGVLLEALHLYFKGFQSGLRSNQKLAARSVNILQTKSKLQYLLWMVGRHKMHHGFNTVYFQYLCLLENIWQKCTPKKWTCEPGHSSVCLTFGHIQKKTFWLKSNNRSKKKNN